MRRFLTVPLLLALFLVPTLPALGAPLTRTPAPAIEALAPYQGQTICSPTAKPGTVALRTLIIKAYKGSGDYGIIRNCTIGGKSEHKEGRAWDWKVSITSSAQVHQVHGLVAWLMAPDRYGNSYAMVRRLGIMYLIWNHRIWTASSHTWRPYTGADPHTSHMHISLSWAGALKRTSYWTGKVSSTVAPPAAPKPAAPKTAAAPKPKAVPLTGTATLLVPARTGAATRFLVAAGRRYLLSVSGTYRYGSGRLADAECSMVGGSWSRRTASETHRTWRGRDGALDLQVGGRDAHWRPASGTTCDRRHSYRLVVQPSSTGALHLKVNDVSYADNSGSLKVTVTRL
jgi:hypothetical protein